MKIVAMIPVVRRGEDMEWNIVKPKKQDFRPIFSGKYIWPVYKESPCRASDPSVDRELSDIYIRKPQTRWWQTAMKYWRYPASTKYNDSTLSSNVLYPPFRNIHRLTRHNSPSNILKRHSFRPIFIWNTKFSMKLIIFLMVTVFGCGRGGIISKDEFTNRCFPMMTRNSEFSSHPPSPQSFWRNWATLNPHIGFSYPFHLLYP